MVPNLIPTRCHIPKDLTLNIHTHGSLDSIKVDEWVYLRVLNETTTQSVWQKTAPQLANKLPNLSVQYCVYTSPPLAPIPSQNNPVHSPTTYSYRSILILYSRSRLNCRSLLHFRSPNNMLSIHTPCLLRFLRDPTHYIPLHFIMLVVFPWH